ncbi:MAG: hypothetical protein R2911_02860 [Caldilineaceae bacterium]
MAGIDALSLVRLRRFCGQSQNLFRPRRQRLLAKELLLAASDLLFHQCINLLKCDACLLESRGGPAFSCANASKKCSVPM